jgi:hypothetical protein
VSLQYSKHVDSPPSSLTVTMIQCNDCVCRLHLESLANSKIMKLLVFSQIYCQTGFLRRILAMAAHTALEERQLVIINYSF